MKKKQTCTFDNLSKVLKHQSVSLSAKVGRKMRMTLRKVKSEINFINFFSTFYCKVFSQLKNKHCNINIEVSFLLTCSQLTPIFDQIQQIQFTIELTIEFSSSHLLIKFSKIKF